MVRAILFALLATAAVTRGCVPSYPCSDCEFPVSTMFGCSCQISPDFTPCRTGICIAGNCRCTPTTLPVTQQSCLATACNASISDWERLYDLEDPYTGQWYYFYSHALDTGIYDGGVCVDALPVPCRTPSGQACRACAFTNIYYNYYGAGNHTCLCDNVHTEAVGTSCYNEDSPANDFTGVCSGGLDCDYQCYSTDDCYFWSQIPCLNAVCLPDHTCSYSPCANGSCVDGVCNECMTRVDLDDGHWHYWNALGYDDYPPCSGGRTCVYGDCIPCQCGTAVGGGCDPDCQYVSNADWPEYNPRSRCACANYTDGKLCATGVCSSGVCVPTSPCNATSASRPQLPCRQTVCNATTGEWEFIFGGTFQNILPSDFVYGEVFETDVYSDGVCDTQFSTGASGEPLCSGPVPIQCKTIDGQPCSQCTPAQISYDDLGQVIACACDTEPVSPGETCYNPAAAGNLGLCSGDVGCTYECYTPDDCYTHSQVPCLNAICVNHTCVSLPCPGDACVNGTCNECIDRVALPGGRWYYSDPPDGDFNRPCSGSRNCVYGVCTACEGGTAPGGGCDPHCQYVINPQWPDIDPDHFCSCGSYVDSSACPTGLCSNGTCRCRNDTDCPAPPCGWSNCTDGVCLSGAPCNETQCHSGVCVMCYADSDCPAAVPGLCELAGCDTSIPAHFCYMIHEDQRHCLNGMGIQCVDPQLDCLPDPCEIYNCTNTTHRCILMDACPPGHCLSDNVTCAIDICVTREECVMEDCRGMCIDGGCQFDCSAGCTHAIGWWHKNAASAFPPLAPFTFAAGSITIADPAGLRDVLWRAYTPNGLEMLETMLLVAELNTALSSAPVPAITGPMSTAAAILSACPPDDPASWPTLLGSGICHGYHITALPPLIMILLDYSNGRLGTPLCTDIGANPFGF